MFRQRRYWFEKGMPRKPRSDKGERRKDTESMVCQVLTSTAAYLRPDHKSGNLEHWRGQSERALQALRTCYGYTPPFEEREGAFVPLWVDRSRFACAGVPRNRYPAGERTSIMLRLPAVWCNWLRAQPVGPGAVIDDAVVYVLALGCTAPLPLERDRLARR